LDVNDLGLGVFQQPAQTARLVQKLRMVVQIVQKSDVEAGAIQILKESILLFPVV
jgi:hypothetical protein